MSVNIKGRHFLSLQDFTPLEVRYLLELSKELKEKRLTGDRGSLLKGRDIVLIFEKSSTRTRCAFEAGAKEEGANVTFLSNTHMGKKESMEDTAKVLGRYYDGIEFRGYKQETIETLAKYSGVPVWNGLTDRFHPTQTLADFLTIMEHVNKPLDKVKLVYVGDARNNMGNSLMIGAAKVGMDFVGLAPKSLFPDKQLVSDMQVVAEETGASISFENDIEKAVLNADIIYTDVWASMGEEATLSERIRLLKPYQVTMDMMSSTNNTDSKFMHCLPAIHDTNTEFGKQVFEQYGLEEMEVTDAVFRGRSSIVFDQAENRLHTIKAVMVATIGNL
jgi:ornithine carbamoyltransferase